MRRYHGSVRTTKLDSKEHVAEVSTRTSRPRPSGPRSRARVASAAANVPELRDDVYDHVLTALRRTPSRGWPLLCVAHSPVRRRRTDVDAVDAALACASSDYARYALFVHEVLGAVASPPSKEI